MGRPLQPLEAKFWRYIEPEPNSGCWLWSGAVGGQPPRWGYGKIKHAGKTLSAHRVGWELKNGPIPDGLCVCHKCDTTRCCNPDHMFLGTHADNAADRNGKGRGMMDGELNHKAKLTMAQILAIRSDTRIARIVAADYAVTRTQIEYIRKRKTWRHVR